MGRLDAAAGGLAEYKPEPRKFREPPALLNTVPLGHTPGLMSRGTPGRTWHSAPGHPSTKMAFRLISHGESKFTYNLHNALGEKSQRRLRCSLSPNGLVKAS